MILTISSLCILPFCFEWIVAEITTPIRCAMLGDKGIEIYLSKEQWRSSRPDLDFSKITLKEINDSWYSPTEEDFNSSGNQIKGYLKYIMFRGSKYRLLRFNPKISLAKYVNTDNANNLFNESYWLYYDTKTDIVILHSTYITGRYKTYTGLGFDDVECKNDVGNLLLINKVLTSYLK
ncbi:hypothetical protein QJU89_04025 [Pasteurella skyensis]|uniref:Uncharacterized protein n=1 Tax=Phocoenobacter skyensis TaxID=97481 RepID=A0AAJ6P002_9PAST|nr:hypothetical protein [Pasteurella skyensis]MDP8162001.1 hypothetical protein [Pasteurella skyensis]MDP8172157.1 hypothetical protein [Pasteurella skyensis]MDP8176495.1 hypothetical protein [Pasteurella skyensis]MDP8178383.1 hypothetical protein [Pasteurella skyensis]MDP8182861.1 hypothetical protein [Pasteurella skyensis]